VVLGSCHTPFLTLFRVRAWAPSKLPSSSDSESESERIADSSLGLSSFCAVTHLSSLDLESLFVAFPWSDSDCFGLGDIVHWHLSHSYPKGLLSADQRGLQIQVQGVVTQIKKHVCMWLFISVTVFNLTGMMFPLYLWAVLYGALCETSEPCSGTAKFGFWC